MLLMMGVRYLTHIASYYAIKLVSGISVTLKGVCLFENQLC